MGGFVVALLIKLGKRALFSYYKITYVVGNLLIVEQALRNVLKGTTASFNAEYCQPDRHSNCKCGVDKICAHRSNWRCYEECNPHWAYDTSNAAERICKTSATNAASRRERLGEVDSCGGNRVGERKYANQETKAHDKSNVVR
mgnify:FL=1